jgi:hypothetical protein
MKRRRNASWPMRVGPWEHFHDYDYTHGAHYDWTGDSGGYDSVEVEAGVYKSNEGEQEVGQGGDRVVWAIDYTVTVAPRGSYGASVGEWTQVYSSKLEALAELPRSLGALRARATKHAGKTVDMRLQ